MVKIKYEMKPALLQRYHHLNRFMNVTNVLNPILSDLIRNHFEDTHILVNSTYMKDNILAVLLAEYAYDEERDSHDMKWYVNKSEYELEEAVSICVPLAMSPMYRPTTEESI